MALTGLMSFLRDVAESPVGLTVGGGIESRLGKWEAEAKQKKEDDDRKKNMVDYFTQQQINEGVFNMSNANKRQEAANAHIQMGVPKFIVDHLYNQGFYKMGDNPYNALQLAESFYGEPKFWLNKEDKNYQNILKRSGQYDIPDYRTVAETNKQKSRSIINGYLQDNYSMGAGSVNLLTSSNVSQEKPIGTKADTKEIPPYTPVYKKPIVLGEGEEAQFRMAVTNPDILIGLGFDIDRDTDFTADGEFNWAALYARDPSSYNSIRLFERLVNEPRSALIAGNAKELGFGNFLSYKSPEGKITERSVVTAAGRVISDVTKGVGLEGEKIITINTVREKYNTENPDNPIITSTDEILRILENTNPDWLDEYKDLQYSKKVLDTNPFMNSPLEFIFEQTQDGKFDNKNYVPIDNASYKEASDNHKNLILFDEKNPKTYTDIRLMHNKLYGENATNIQEGGTKLDIPYFVGGTGRSITGIGGPQSEDIMYSEQYMVPNTINYKEKVMGTSYEPMKGLGDTASSILWGTEIGNPEALSQLQNDMVDSPDELPIYIMSLLQDQQEKGLLPKSLTAADLEILASKAMDDIVQFEYEAKTDVTAPVTPEKDELLKFAEDDGVSDANTQIITADNADALQSIDDEITEILETTPIEKTEESELFPVEPGDKPWLLADGSFNSEWAKNKKLRQTLEGQGWDKNTELGQFKDDLKKWKRENFKKKFETLSKKVKAHEAKSASGLKLN